MPRTKAARKKPTSRVSEHVQMFIKEIEKDRTAVLKRFDEIADGFFTAIDLHLEQSLIQIPPNIRDKTIGELTEYGLNTTSSIFSRTVDTTVTKSVLKDSRTNLRRSTSFVDEGYLTAESANGNSGGRTSRARVRIEHTTTKRLSKSASQTVVKPTKPTVLNRFKTPAGRLPPASYGLITPKVAPGMPQVLLRRPKQGEVAVSLQGSPLMTGTMVTDHEANINIPLEDGRMLSIQPKKGLRMSQIPEMDLDTQRQLETLRDNLNKVVDAVRGKH